MLRRLAVLLLAATLLAGCTSVQNPFALDPQQRSPQNELEAVHAADGFALIHMRGSADTLYTTELRFLHGDTHTWMAAYLLREGRAERLSHLTGPLPARHLSVGGVDLLPRDAVQEKEKVGATSLTGQFTASGRFEWLLLIWQNQSEEASGFSFLGPPPTVLETLQGTASQSFLLGQGSSLVSAGAYAGDAAVEERFRFGSVENSLTIIASSGREATFAVEDAEGSRGFDHGTYEKRVVFMTTKGPTEVTTTTVGSYAGRFLLMNLDLGDFPMPRSVWQYGS